MDVGLPAAVLVQCLVVDLELLPLLSDAEVCVCVCVSV